MSIKLSDLPLDAQRQAMSQLREVKKAPKYGNVKTDVGALKFDSKKEARRFEELMLRLRAGDIRDLRLQQDFTMVEGFTDVSGKRTRPMKYRADFVYERRTAPDANGDIHWVRVVEDVKSTATKTAQYAQKKKLMKEIYGIDIAEV